MDLHLRNQIAVVTGGASGIGRAVAEAFAAEGTHVAIWDVAENVSEVADQIEQKFQQPTLSQRVDITDRDDIAEAIAETESQFGPIDHLVHAAAVGSGKFGFPFTNLAPADWPKVLEINIMGMVNVAHALAPGMRDRKRGTMIFIASIAGQIGSQTDPPYSASKAANINFAQCMAKDLASDDIRVNVICPGMIKTPLNQSVWQAWNDRQPADQKQSYEDWAAEKIRTVIPLGRWQEASDVADMAVFLSSQRTVNVTGQVINVDGGFVMHW